MTIVSPMGQLRPVFADKNGKRLSGGKVFTYEPGTLTPKATYTDALNLIPNTNPINLDESGEADIYLDGGYRMQVYDRYGALIQDVDNFRTWASGIPAESIFYGSQDLKQFNADVESSLNNRYTKEETYGKSEIDASLTAVAGGRKAYQTLALAQADQASLPANTIVEVTNDPTASNNGTYQWNGTTLTKSPYDPLTQGKNYTDQSLDFKAEKAMGAVLFALVDNDDRAGFQVYEDGTVKVVSLDVYGATLSQEDDSPFAYKIADKNGNIAFAVYKDGTVTFKSAIGIDTLNGGPVGAGSSGVLPTPQAIKTHGYTAEVNGVASYGQSLAAGSTSTPVISTVQKYDNLMFNSGTRPSDEGTNPTIIYASLQPLVESVGGVNGETPLSGMTDNIKELIFNEENLAYTDMSYKFLASAPAHGGQNISSLTKGSDYYLRLFNDIKYGALRAADTNQSYAYQATTWLQGEADYSSGTTKTIYKLILAGLIDNITADAITLTEQTFNPEFIIGQVGSHLRYAQSAGVVSAFKADIAQAQLELSKERSDVHLACPSYQFDYSGTVNQVHLTATDERVMGAYFGLVYKRVVIDGQDWQPLQPMAITKSKRSVYITLNNKSPLVIDTDWVTQNTNYGFRVFDDGVQANIADVSIVNGNAIKITLDSDLLGVMTVDYALFSDSPTGETGRNVGARGNIRDSQGDTIIFDPNGVNRPLHNWLVMFTYKEGTEKWV